MKDRPKIPIAALLIRGLFHVYVCIPDRPKILFSVLQNGTKYIILIEEGSSTGNALPHDHPSYAKGMIYE